MQLLIDLTKEVQKRDQKTTVKFICSKINGDYYQIDTAFWTGGGCESCNRALASWNVITVNKDELKPLYDSLKELFES